jgi:hypothetical protein
LKKPLLLFVLLCWGIWTQAISQTISIKAKAVPLNQLFVTLRDQYQLKFSFNDELLAKYSVSIDKIFTSPNQAIQFLIKDFPLRCIEQDHVYLILPKEKKERRFSLSGQLLEYGTNESLPFANLLIGDKIFTGDVNGNFNYPNSTDSLFHIQATYLGHYLLDTIVPAGNNYRFKLIPSSIGLKEIVVKGESADQSLLIGERAGQMKINNQVARFIPGNDDNSVFNLLRLMPGILASSEQSNGLMIWGSYEGFSQILFDGFTIWGLKSFSDEINTINPLIIKDMEVLKGGYNAAWGERVGGIVNITSKNGNETKPSATININNVTLNGLIETPLWRNTSALLSFRKTYYNQFEDKDILTPDQKVILNQPLVDYTLHPDYNFRDANFKFTTKNDQGDLFYISLLGGEDLFQYHLDRTFGRNELSRIQRENNIQSGAAAYYSKSWKKGNISDFKVSWSGLMNNFRDIQSLLKNQREFESRNNFTSNQIDEYSFSTDNWFSLNNANRIEAGAGFILDKTELIADSSAVRKTSFEQNSERLQGFIQDHISLPGRTNLIIGIRGDYPANLQKVYLQPRLSASINLNKYTKLNLAWGKYSQFIAQSSVLDQSGNYRYLWTTCDNVQVPVLNSEHYVVGSSYKRNGFNFSLEGYFKNTDGLTRFINKNQQIGNTIYQGEGKSYGIDLFLRKDYGPHAAWISYTLSKTLEWFPYFPSSQFMRAPQDQRHELKAAILLDFKPFSFSANYIFGSGFPLNSGTLLNPDIIEPDYNRLDAALFYRFKIKGISGETGISILNVLNSKNIRYSNFEKIPVDQTSSIHIYSEAVPFSTRFSLKISL